MQLAEKMETNNVSGKRQRKKSRMARESDEMDFIVSRVVPSEPEGTSDSNEVQQPPQQQLQQQGEDQQQYQEKQPQQEQKEQQARKRSKSNTKKTQDNKTKSTPDRKEQQQKSSKKEEQKKKKNAQIGAGRTQAAAFFKDRLSAADNQNKEQPAGLVNHSPSPPSHPHSPLLQNTSLPTVTLPAPSHTVSQPMYGLSPLSVNLPSQSPDQSRMNLPRETDPPSLGVNPLTLHRNPLSHTSLPTQSSTLYNASLLQPSQSSPEHRSLHMGHRLPSDLNPQPQSLFSPISVHSNPVDLTILPSVAAPTLGETGSLIRSSLHNVECSPSPSSAMTLDSSFGSLSDNYCSAGDDEHMDEVVMPCERCSQLVHELRAEIVALRKRQLPGK